MSPSKSGSSAFATSAGKLATSAGVAARRFLRLLLVTSWGRLCALAALIAVVLFFAARDEVLSTLGWGAVPVFAWLAYALFLLTGLPERLAARWRVVLALFAGASAVVGGLGMAEAPSDTFGASAGGLVGAAIARYPIEWDMSGGTGPQLTLGAIRVAGVVVVGAAVMWPAYAALAARSIAGAAAAAYVLAVAAGHAGWRRVQDSLEARRARRAVGIDSFDAESVPGRVPIVTTESGDEDAGAETLPAGMAPGAPEGEARPADIAPPDEPAETLVASTDFEWTLPPTGLLETAPLPGVPQAEIDATSQLIVDTLVEHGVDVSIGQVKTGPTVTMYGIVPGYGGRRRPGGNDGPETEDVPRPRTRVRVDTILARERDLALALASPSLRFEAPVPGESLVGIEVPNSKPASVALRSVMESIEFEKFAETAELPIALGIGSDGEPVFADLSRMPHVLVAGATGSGKSVCINALLSGLLMVRTPADLRLLLIDPKRVELTPYDGIPHLYVPTVVEPDRTVTVLKAIANEMMRRFKVLESAGAKNIVSFNEKATTKMPYIVVAVDELADLMLFAANEVERTLVRLAQLGRATGVHLVVATQRPSVDVVTGLIKANFPSRIAFAVMSQVDSRTILDTPGADKLLGRGDMLFLPVDRAKPMRIQGAFLTDPEVERVVRFWQEAKGPPMPQLEISLDGDSGPSVATGAPGGDSLFDQAEALASARTQLSTSLLQRRLRIGYPRAARLMDELEEAGIVGPGEPGKPRIVLRTE